MRYLLILSILISASQAFAVRYGRDERVFTCTSTAESAAIGINEKFQVHVVDRVEIKVTRLSDGKFITGRAGHYSDFYFSANETRGDLFPANLKGVISQWRGNYNFALYKSTGFQETVGEIENCQLEEVISEYDPLTATEVKVQAIGEEADVANGGYEFTRFALPSLNMSQEKEELIAEGKEWERCTWEMAEGLPKILDLMENHTYDKNSADKMKALAQVPGLLHAVAYVSDSDISCSNTIVRVYTKDGIRLELYYSQGD